jgi:hypothetical protein
MQKDEFAWLSLLQRRAEYARKSAASARSTAVAKEFEELALLYDGIAGREQAKDRPAPGARSAIARGDPKSELIKHLQSRSHQLMMDARTVTDRKRADDLKYLAGAYGAEAVRVKNDGMM